MEAKEAQVVASAETGHDKFLLGLGWGGFLDDGLNLIEQITARNSAAADGSIKRELALVSGLYGRDGTVFRGSGGEKLGRTGRLGPAEVEVVTDHQEERVVGGEICRAVDSMGIAECLGLFNEAHATGMRPGGCSVGGFVTGANDDGDFLDARRDDFIGKDGKCGPRCSIPVDQSLEREGALGFSGGGDYGFTDFHNRDSVAPVRFGNCSERGPGNSNEPALAVSLAMILRRRGWLRGCCEV